MDEEITAFSIEKKSVNLLIVIATSISFLFLQLWEKSLTQGMFFGHTTKFLLDHGALYGPALREGEWYRLITHLFLHDDIMHLGHNMLILFFLGNVLERHLGKISYVILYFLSGILAAIGSVVYNTTDMVSIGASGAVFGVVGAMVWVVIRNKGKVEGITKEQMLIFLVLSVLAGMGDYSVDNAAHIAGLIAGFLLGILLYRKKTEETNACDRQSE